ncbi:fic family toxin-antitoxin system, toxin component [Streptomyces pharetrae]|uniref:fic family toxin-antitoxin system, toxin component n=1 Tax=Streptomyces pharetrae TaxID=291370 RepID=UPI003354797D
MEGLAVVVEADEARALAGDVGVREAEPVPVSAVARHRAELFEQPVYDGPYAKAAALVHTLGRCRWLERSNLAVAAATGVMYLEAAGIAVKPAREDAIALKDLLLDPACTAGKIATLLRTWPTAT